MNVSIKNPFERKQKGAVLMLCVLLLAGGLYSCSSKNDPAEAILGKWELIAKGAHENAIRTVEPYGVYIEFLSEGISRVYNPEMDEFFYRSYKIDKKFIYYNPEKTYEQGRIDYRYSISKNQLKMTYHKISFNITGVDPTIFIYQPKN